MNNQEGVPPPFAKKKRETLTSEPVAIDEKFLREFFSSRTFLSKLVLAKKIMERGLAGEAGFVILKDLASNSTHISEILTSKSSSIEEAYQIDVSTLMQDFPDRLEQKFPKRKFVHFGGLHFHSNEGQRDCIIIPSTIQGDLENTGAKHEGNALLRGYNFPPIDMIAVITGDGEIKILFYQEPVGYIPTNHTAIANDISESLNIDEIKSQEEVLETLRHFQYKVAIVRTTKGAFDQEALKTLATFAFVPTRAK